MPLKEGRSYHGGPLSVGGTGRGRKRNQALLILVVICAIPLYFFVFSGGSIVDTRTTSIPNIPNNPNAPARDQIGLKDQPKPVAGGRPQDTYSDDKQAPFKPPPQGQQGYIKDEEPARPYVDTVKPGRGKGYGSTSNDVAVDEEPASSGKQPGSKSSAPNGGKVKWIERPQFEKALAKVINMLPGEMHMRDLLRPVEGTGKERVREMGLRTRAYKSYFEAWEDLHLDTDTEGGTYVRDDVVQYLRAHVQDEMKQGAGIPGLEMMDLANMIRSYESYRYFLAKFGQMLFPWTAPYFSDHMSLHAHFKRGGRGIVLTAGDDQAAYLMTSIPILREIGCYLPIEVMYLGDSDLSEDYRSDLEAMDGVVTRDIAQMVNDEGWRLAGWAAKPFAMLFSSFREVIFIDADSLFFKNPEILFDDPGYKKTGALFFKDRMIMPESKKRMLQQMLPKPISKQVKHSRFWLGESGHMQESGVVVIDKFKHFMAMLMVTRMNGPDRDGNKDEGRIGVYDLVYGDKETFWLGWELVGDPEYVFHTGDAGIMGDLNKDSKTDKEQREEEQKKGEEWAKKKAEDKKRKEEQQKKDEEEQKQKAEERDRQQKEEDKRAAEAAAEKPNQGDGGEETKKDEPGTNTDNGEQKQLRKRSDEGGQQEEQAQPERRDPEPDPNPDAPTHSSHDYSSTPTSEEGEEEDSPTPAPAPGPAEDSPQSYTLCSPQLLHLDTDGTPLWFNGWLLDNKFADKSKKKFGTFKHYLIEPREVREPGAWQLHENNECCLTVEREGMRVFSREELRLLDKMMKKAREVGAPGA